MIDFYDMLDAMRRAADRVGNDAAIRSVQQAKSFLRPESRRKIMPRPCVDQQATILSFLRVNGPAQISAIMVACNLHKSQTQRLMTKLHASGQVQRRKIVSDGSPYEYEVTG